MAEKPGVPILPKQLHGIQPVQLQHLLVVAMVTIQLSTDGGNTYPVTLLANTPNDGSQQVVMPATATNTARIRIMAVNNIFFDISNNNFTIAGPYITNANGNWNNPSTWLGGVVPTAGVDVVVQHVVAVTANASCYSLTIQPLRVTSL